MLSLDVGNCFETQWRGLCDTPRNKKQKQHCSKLKMSRINILVHLFFHVSLYMYLLQRYDFQFIFREFFRGNCFWLYLILFSPFISSFEKVVHKYVWFFPVYIAIDKRRQRQRKRCNPKQRCSECKKVDVFWKVSCSWWGNFFS